MVTLDFPLFPKKIRNIVLELLLLIIISSLVFGCATPSQKATGELKQYSVIIGTGVVMGVYYPTGGAICKIINKERKIHGIHCSVESTKGSVYNINAIMAREFDFGMAQSDRQWQAWNGLSGWQGRCF